MNDLDIQVMKLDEAYTDSNMIAVRVDNFQEKLLEELERIINNLKNHWHGSDAYNHINSLIEEYDKNVDSFTQLSAMTTFLSKYFVLLQKTRAKMSDITRVGDEEEAKFKARKIEKIEETKEYYYDEQMKSDYDDICNLNEYYSQFLNELESNSTKLMQNWKAGTGRDDIQKFIGEYINSAKDLYNKLKDFEEQIRIVIDNESRIV